MKTVRVTYLNVPANRKGKTVQGHLIESNDDLLEAVSNQLVHPLSVKGIKSFIEKNEQVFVNENGGYCNVSGNIEIIK